MSNAGAAAKRGQGEKFAVMVPATVPGTLHGLLAVPSHGPPLQPRNTCPTHGTAVTGMETPNSKMAGRAAGVVLPQPVTPIVAPPGSVRGHTGTPASLQNESTAKASRGPVTIT